MADDEFTRVMRNTRGPLNAEQRERLDAAVNTYSALVKLVQIRAGRDSSEVQQRLDEALQRAHENAGGRPVNVDLRDVIDLSRDALREAGLAFDGGRFALIEPS